MLKKIFAKPGYKLKKKKETKSKTKEWRNTMLVKNGYLIKKEAEINIALKKLILYLAIIEEK